MSNTVLPKWSRLDNAAKIFSANNSVMDSKVFRFACELEDLVDSDILQFALEKTMQHFPFFRRK